MRGGESCWEEKEKEKQKQNEERSSARLCHQRYGRVRCLDGYIVSILLIAETLPVPFLE